MTLLFIVALLLAWPTFGISLLLWFAILVFRGKQQADATARRHVTSEVIEPLFRGRFSDFYKALDIPHKFDADITDESAHQCGRHIMNYLSHNPSEAAIFVKGLKKWALKGSGNLCDPVEAAETESRYDAKEEIHLVSYRAIEALMKQNSLRCFNSVDLDALSQYISAIESRARLQAN